MAGSEGEVPLEVAIVTAKGLKWDEVERRRMGRESLLAYKIDRAFDSVASLIQLIVEAVTV